VVLLTSGVVLFCGIGAMCLLSLVWIGPPCSCLFPMAAVSLCSGVVFIVVSMSARKIIGVLVFIVSLLWLYCCPLWFVVSLSVRFFLFLDFG